MDFGPDETDSGAEQASTPNLVEKPDRVSNVSDVKTGPPSATEWQDFFGRFLIRLIVNGYISMVLGDLVDELTPAEAKAIYLSKEDMREIAAPFASVAVKSPVAKKYGRTIIGLSDSYESVFDLVLWMRRVNRIAKKHKKANQPQQRIQPQPQNVEIHDEVANGFDRGQVDGSGAGIIGVFNPGGG